MAVEPVPFAIRTSAIGGRLELDGEDVTEKVAAFDLRVGLTEPTVLSVHMIPGTGAIEGDAIVHVVDEARSVAEVVCEFLSTVDPQRLEQDCLSDASCSPFAAVLSVLCHYATNEGL